MSRVTPGCRDYLVRGFRRASTAVSSLVRSAGGLLRDAGGGWQKRNASRTAAAIAYYGVFSLAPLLVIVVSMSGYLFGQDAAEGLVVDRLTETLGPEGAAFVQSLLARVYSSKGTLVATILAVLVLLFGASRVIGAMRGALNDVWGVKGRAGGGVKGYVLTKIFDLGMVLVIGTLFVATMAANAVASAVVGRFTDALPLPNWALVVAGIAFSLIVVISFVTLVFRVLPNMRVPWRDALVGAAMTAVLAGIGNYLIGLYLGRASITSVFGAAGALVVLMIWTYYIAQIVLFGAEIARAHHDRRDSPAAIAPRPSL